MFPTNDYNGMFQSFKVLLFLITNLFAHLLSSLQVGISGGENNIH